MKVCEMIEKLRARKDQNEEICAIIWSDDDVRENSEQELTDEQVKNILNAMECNHDANIGINWDVISYHTDTELNRK